EYGGVSYEVGTGNEVVGTALMPEATAASTRARHASMPRSQSKLSVWRPRRSGAERGSWIFANETRREAVRSSMSVAVGALEVREAAKRGPSRRRVACACGTAPVKPCRVGARSYTTGSRTSVAANRRKGRSEEHTSELQS